MKYILTSIYRLRLSQLWREREVGKGCIMEAVGEKWGGIAKLADFAKGKDVVPSLDSYAIRALSGMAQGLFASLLMGTILTTIGNLSGLEVFVEVGDFAKKVTGPAMAIAIAYALRAPALVLLSVAAVGLAANELGGAGGPLAVYVIAVLATEIGKLVAGETKIDILVTPFVVIVVGCALSLLLAPSIGQAASSLGSVIMWACDLAPLWMGAVISIVVGIALTLPISSAAICAALGLTGLAGGAALAGCCAQMVGFAVIGFRANGISGIVSMGLGTSMLQMSNILKNPWIWVPPIIASAVGGPAATCVFGLAQNGPAIASGMGTCGLVGPIGVYTGWIDAGITPGLFEWTALVCVCLVIPALVSLLVFEVMKRFDLVKDEDLNLSV